MSDAINPDHYKRLPAEAIEIIESAIDKAPSNQAALLHGQVLKYILRCWHKNGIEDLRKAKWYLNRLIDSFDESEAEQLATGEVTGEVTGEGTGEVKPPEGWRFLEVGEVIRKGDLRGRMGGFYATEPIMLGMALPKHWKPMLRRNKFEVGEKVVHVPSTDILEVVEVVEVAGEVKVADIRGSVSRYYPEVLAPYIEEAK